MTRAIVDTTVLTDALLKENATGARARDALKGFAVTSLPAYAIKELKAGPLHNYIWFHNKIVATKNWAASVEAIRLVMFGRKNMPATALEALRDFESSVAKQMTSDLATKYPNMTVEAARRIQAQSWLKQKIVRAWRKRRTLTSEVVTELGCYVESDLKFLPAGTIDDKPQKCGVNDCCLRLIYAKRLKEIETLEESCVGDKHETTKRRKALKELRRKPKRDFSEEFCRSLGDAVFAMECKDDDFVLTTNVVDHAPLANSLGFSVVHPDGSRTEP